MSVTWLMLTLKSYMEKIHAIGCAYYLYLLGKYVNNGTPQSWSVVMRNLFCCYLFLIYIYNIMLSFLNGICLRCGTNRYLSRNLNISSPRYATLNLLVSEVECPFQVLHIRFLFLRNIILKGQPKYRGMCKGGVRLHMHSMIPRLWFCKNWCKKQTPFLSPRESVSLQINK